MLLANLLNAQEEVTAGELMINVKNNSTNPKNVAIQIEKWSGLCWTAYNNIHDLTNGYNGTTIYTPYPSSNHQFQIFGCWEHPTGPPETMGLALYKITGYVQITDNGNYVYKDHFYIDYRTSAIAENCPAGCDYQIDFSVYNGLFTYRYTSTPFPENVQIWNLVSVPHITTELEPLPPLDIAISSPSGNPYLTWDGSDNIEDFWTGYCIYRSVVSGRGGSPGVFSKIATVSNTTTSFTDYDFSSGGPMTAYYKITSINGTRESIFTPIVSSYVGFYKLNFKKYEFSLSQNYPNPFNPITSITFSVPERQSVSIKIYDILGKEIITLIDEIKEAGEHRVTFSASDLNSGIYFYVMCSNGFVETKKLTIVK